MQIKIYVVRNEDLAKLLNEAIKLEKVKKRLIKLFGGLTVSKSLNEGYWMNEKGEIEKDCVKVWEILINSKEDLVKNEKKFKEVIEDIKAITQQKSQLYTVNESVKANFI